MKHSHLILSGLATLLAFNASAGEFTMTTGLDYSSGKYGTSETSEIWYLPIAAKYETGPVTLKLTIPYLRITNAVVDQEGVPIGNCGGTKTGLGDISASAGYALLDGTEGGWLLDAVGKVKLPTAESDCLGSDKTDYALQFDVAKSFGSVTGFGTLGWKNMGNSDFRNPFYASLGIAAKVAPATTIGTTYDWREKLTSRGDPVSEASVFLSQKLSKEWKLQVYVMKGFSDSSPDNGGGLMVSYSY